MLGYVHDTGKIWKLWDFEQKRAVESADVVFNEENNVLTDALQTNDDDMSAVKASAPP